MNSGHRLSSPAPPRYNWLPLKNSLFQEQLISHRQFPSQQRGPAPWFYYVSRVLVKTLLFLLTRFQVKGRENIPGQGPVLIVSNHLELADVPILVVSLGQKVVFLAKEQLFRYPLVNYFVSHFDSIRVRRGKLDRNALRQAIQTLTDGQALVIFPEGTRSKKAQLRPAFSGTALIALRSGAPILPVAITGTERTKGVTWVLRRPRITVNIGQPFHLPAANGKLTKIELTEHTNRIMGRIARLLPPEYRGHYAKQEETDEAKS